MMKRVDAQQALLQPRQLARIPRLEQLSHKIGGPCEEDAALLFRGFDAEGNREMRFAGADPPRRIRACRAARAPWQRGGPLRARGGPRETAPTPREKARAQPSRHRSEDRAA